MADETQPGSAPERDPNGSAATPSDPDLSDPHLSDPEAPGAALAGPTPGGPPPAGPTAVVPRRSAMAVRLIAVAIALVLALAIAFVVVVVAGPPSVEELRNRAGLDGRRQLLIGVKDDQPGVAVRKGNTWTGFDIDVAYMIAEDLGFRPSEVKFVAIESEDRARMQATDVDGSRVGVDLVIASYSITPEREAVAGVTFSAPYLFTEQSVVTRSDHPDVSTLEDLAGAKACSLATATSETPAKRAGVNVVSRKKIGDCFIALNAGLVDAVTTDAAILAGYKTLEPTKYKHFDIGLEATEAWGVNVGENDALRDLVNLTLYRSREDPKDTRWEEAFDTNLRVEEESNEDAPIAVDQQPLVKDKPDVRQWPWERVGP